MNGRNTSKKAGTGYDAGPPVRGVAPTRGAAPIKAVAPLPVGKNMVEGYRKDILAGFEPVSPPYNPMNQERIQSSLMVDLKDPIQVHLLTETALLDSQSYVVLSSEEMDELKKQCQSLAQRIEQTRTNLVIQAKYRDAAVSITKLYSPGKQDGRRLSLLVGRRNSNGDSAREAEAERLVSERRCEELAIELWNLEKRMIEPQRRILEHTAGVLQLTHSISGKNAFGSLNGGLGFEGPDDDAVAFTRNKRELSKRGKTALAMSDGAPNPEQNNQFREEAEELREETSRAREETRQLRAQLKKLTREGRSRIDNDDTAEESRQLRAQLNALTQELDMARQGDSRRPDFVSSLEQRLKALGSSMRRAIVDANPVENINFMKPPKGTANGSSSDLDPGEILSSQVDYLEQGLSALVSEYEAGRSATGDRVKKADLSIDRSGEQADVLGQQIRKLLATINPAFPPLPNKTGSGLDDKLEYLEDSLRVVQSEAVQAMENNNKILSAKKSKDDQTDELIRGLWDSILPAIRAMQSSKDKKRKAGTGAVEEDEEGGVMSEDDNTPDPNEPFSAPAFASKVRFLSTKMLSLLELKARLVKQVGQLREAHNILNSVSKADKLELDNLRLVHEDSRINMTQIEAEVANTKDKLSRAIEVSEAKDRPQIEEAENRAREVAIQLTEKEAEAAKLEAANRELQAKVDEQEPIIKALTLSLQRAEASVANLDGKLADAVEAKKQADVTLAIKNKELAVKMAETEVRDKAVKDKDEEIERLNVMAIELKTDLTMMKADLDAAYGSRKQRAAEMAAIKSTDDVIRLQTEVDELKTQLAQTVDELEQITKETLAAEREKLDAESRLDDAIAARSTMEADLAELQTRLDDELASSRAAVAKLQEELEDERLKGASADGQAGGGPRAGTVLLTEQFRTTMREERKRFGDDLKEEQARRRKLEEELNKLKRKESTSKK